MAENTKKYRFNPETMLYEVREKSRKFLAAKSALIFLGSLVLFPFYFWLYSSVLGLELPKTAILRRQNASWLSRIEVLNRRMDGYSISLSELETKDEDIYRSIFGMKEIPPEVRNSGLGGFDRYDFLENCDHSGLLKRTMMRQDMLVKKAYIQSKSFDDVSSLAKRAGDMASCIPAIPPMLPDISKYHLSSPFGFRNDPHYHYTKMHTGYDFSMKPGNRIYATGDGVVESAAYEFYGYGNCITIDHGFGYKTRYAHMKVINVIAGMKVKRGQFIGESGNSGKTTGPHLHYEVLYKDRYVNPLNYMDLDMPVEEYRQMIDQVAMETPGEMVLPMHRKKRK